MFIFIPVDPIAQTERRDMKRGFTTLLPQVAFAVWLGAVGQTALGQATDPSAAKAQPHEGPALAAPIQPDVNRAPSALPDPRDRVPRLLLPPTVPSLGGITKTSGDLDQAFQAASIPEPPKTTPASRPSKSGPVGSVELSSAGADAASSLSKPPAPLAPLAAEPVDESALETETVTQRNADGSVAVERSVARDEQNNYINHGKYTQYSPDGNVIKSGQYNHGKLDGHWMQVLAADAIGPFADDLAGSFPGPFISEADFKQGKLDGIWSVTGENQAKIVEWHFRNGLRDGQWTWWYPNGELRRAVTFENGKATGVMLRRDLKGETTVEAEFVDGRAVIHKIEWHRPDQKAYEGAYLAVGKEPQPIFDWWRSVATVRQAATTKYVKHGPWVSWYANGQKQVEGEFREDVPTGKFTWWYESGQKQCEGSYQDGIQVGPWLSWHPSGQKESQADYLAGLMRGKFYRWNPDGQIAEFYDFDKNQKLAQPAGLTQPDLPADKLLSSRPITVQR